MQNPEDGIGEALAKSFNANRQQHRLELSDTSQLKAEKAQVEKRRQYGQDYWQRYKRQKKRIFGTLPIQIYQELLARAEAHDKTPWQLIWAEAKAYRAQTILPTQELADQQRQLVIPSF